ncbi:hypothetical protein G7043_46100 [Lentzea sp. NEAU-D13]|uniref:Uncharacterized protein n=1 Tax=Lentzea alba TaxID=2714351 RepID=A0A7C9RYT3_9PSEU|nr:hypothetical protein [Lentzea alba]NGY66284.1 hypothetical protein [Lentzea alba]
MANSAGSARSEGTEVTLRSKTMLLDFAGECQVEGAGDAVRLTELWLTADLPDAGGAEDGGTVQLELDGDVLTATVVQPGGKVELTAREPVRWSASGGDVQPVDEEIGFVLAEAPESTVLLVRGLTVRMS